MDLEDRVTPERLRELREEIESGHASAGRLATIALDALDALDAYEALLARAEKAEGALEVLGHPCNWDAVLRVASQRNAAEDRAESEALRANKAEAECERLRAVLDGMDGIAYADDSQVVELHGSKHWAEPGKPEGASITVRPA